MPGGVAGLQRTFARDHDEGAVAASHWRSSDEPGGFEAADVVARDALAAAHHQLQRQARRRAHARQPLQRAQRTLPRSDARERHRASSPPVSEPQAKARLSIAHAISPHARLSRRRPPSPVVVLAAFLFLDPLVGPTAPGLTWDCYGRPRVPPADAQPPRRPSRPLHIPTTWRGSGQVGGRAAWRAFAGEVVRIVVELRDGDPVSELSQTVETATSGAGVEGVV